MCAALLGYGVVHTPGDTVSRIVALIKRVGPLPGWPKTSPKKLFDAMHADKKARGGRVRFVLAPRLGEASSYDDVPAKMVECVLRCAQRGWAVAEGRAFPKGTQPEGATSEQDASQKVREMFTRIAPRYDLLNHLLSGQMDKRWRARTARELQPILRRADAVVLDLCCGTGDLAFSLAERWTEAGVPAGIGGSVEFRTDVFDAASIEVDTLVWNGYLARGNDTGAGAATRGDGKPGGSHENEAHCFPPLKAF